MFPNGRVLTSESDDLLPVEIVKQPRVDLPRELNKRRKMEVFQMLRSVARHLTHLIKELIQQLDVDKHRGGISQLFGNDV
jgi:hypothetical protein